MHFNGDSIGWHLQDMGACVPRKLSFLARAKVLLSGLSTGLILAALSLPAQAEDVVDTTMTQSRYVLGATLVSSAQYPGSDQRETKLRPLWAYQYGRWRLSSSRASAVLGFARDAAGPGASAELVNAKNWHLGAAFRFDSGRKASDSPDLHGLPDVPRTLRGRIYASYAFNRQWSIGGNVSQDLLGRGGGAQASIDLGHRYWVTPRIEWTSGMGVTLANQRNMTTYFGISDAQASQSGQRPFAPGAGLRDVHLGTGLTTTITPHWIAFANIGWSRLLGDAAVSPLTRRASSVAGTLGIVYRN